VSVIGLKLLGSDVKVPNTVLESLNSNYADFWRGAMQTEMDSQLKKAFEPVDRSEVNKNATVVDTRWVVAIKTDSEGYVNRFKARLVARGFTEVDDKDYGDVYAPVVGVDGVRILCALAAIKNMKMWSFDVMTAFLNAPIDREIFIQMPTDTKDHDESHSCIKFYVRSMVCDKLQISGMTCSWMLLRILDFSRWSTVQTSLSKDQVRVKLLWRSISMIR
jgi:hypothetical protein